MPDAHANNPAPKIVTIMNHAPRYDLQEVYPMGLKPKLANFANSYILELWLDSPRKDSIVIGSHNLACSISERKMRHTDERTGRFDGVHPYGSTGKTAYTESVVNILLSSLQVNIGKASDDDHTRCPQSKYTQKQKKKYSDVVTGNPPAKTQNRFSCLSEN